MFTIGTPGAAREVIRLLYAGDRLCAYGDQLLVYSAAGELAEAGGWRYEWKSRRLSSMRTDGKTLTFRCNASGQRLQKRMDASWLPVITSYSWRQGRLAQMVIARTGYDEIERKTTLRYSYDERGCPEMVEYNGTAYTCLCDSAGSVVALLDGSGETAVSYDYDAWGRQLAVQDLHDGAQQFLRRGRCVVLCAGRQRPAEHPQQRRCEEQLHDLRDVGDVQAVLRGVGPLPADSLILDKKNGGVALWQATPVRFAFISL